MKNVFLTLAFMLVGTLTFANNVETETIIENVTVENVKSVENIKLEEEVGCGFTVNYDTEEHGIGSFWMDCDDSVTMDDILDILMDMFF